MALSTERFFLRYECFWQKVLFTIWPYYWDSFYDLLPITHCLSKEAAKLFNQEFTTLHVNSVATRFNQELVAADEIVIKGSRRRATWASRKSRFSWNKTKILVFLELKILHGTLLVPAPEWLHMLAKLNLPSWNHSDAHELISRKIGKWVEMWHLC